MIFDGKRSKDKVAVIIREHSIITLSCHTAVVEENFEKFLSVKKKCVKCLHFIYLSQCFSNLKHLAHLWHATDFCE